MEEKAAAEVVQIAKKSEIAILREKTARACHDEVAAVLDRHGCILVGVPLILPDGRIAAQVELRVKE